MSLLEIQTLEWILPVVEGQVYCAVLLTWRLVMVLKQMMMRKIDLTDLQSR
jgi:hypothetical protein